MLSLKNNMLTHKKTNLRLGLLRIFDCGLADYTDILNLQLKLQEQRRCGQIPDTILIVEHQPVITLGVRKSANRLLVSAEELTKRRIDLIEIRRGGSITAHNQGQLVLYPILNLKLLGLNISEYIKHLQQIGTDLLNRLGVKAESKKGYPGLWVGEEKIASIGVRVSRQISCHGMAININNDLSIFDLFIPCGLEGVKMTSAEKITGRQYSMADIKKQLAELLVENFSDRKAEYGRCSQITSLA
jgi:lipoate-protein ligase B